MLPQYTFALGGTDKIKKIVEFLDSQAHVLPIIKQKEANKEAYAIE